MNKNDNEILHLKEDFPVLINNPGITYLDSAATSLKPQVVIDKLNEYYTKYGVNVNRGVYKLSYEATEEYEETRRVVAKFINANEDEIIYTKGTSNGLNMLALSLGEDLKPGDNVVTTELEHHSSVLPWQQMCNKKGATLKYIKLNEEGRITLEEAKKVIDENTKYVVITHVSNVMGYISPVKEIAALAHTYNAKIIVDAAQSAPHMKLDVKDLDCDFLAFSAHKMLGPTGFGILYGKRKYLKDLKPVEYGGDMIDEVFLYDSTTKDAPYKFETGTPPISEAIAFKEAIRYLDNIGMDKIKRHEEILLDYAYQGLKKIDGIKIHNVNPDTGIICFNIWNIHPHDASTIFDERNVCLRAGHHCAQLITKWLGVVGTLRMSIYLYNDFEDIDNFLSAAKQASDYFKEW